MNAQNLGGIYTFAGRVTFGQFADAAAETVRGIALAADPSLRGSLTVRTTTNGGQTASVQLGHLNRPDVVGGGRTTVYVVNLPSYDPDTLISATYATRLLAFIVHETLHILWTDLHKTHRRIADYALTRGEGGEGAQARARFHNACEDYAIETHACDPARPVVGNAGALLGALNETMLAPLAVQAVEQAPDARTQAINLILAAINRHGRQDAPAMARAWIDAQAAADPQVLVLVRKTLDQLDRATGKEGAQRRTDLAMALFDALDGVTVAQPPQDEGQDEGKPQDGQDGQGEGEGEGEGAGAGQGEDEGEGEGEGEGAGAGQGEGEGEGAGAGQGEAQDEGAGAGQGEGGQKSDADTEAKGGAGTGADRSKRGDAPQIDPDEARRQALADAAPQAADEGRAGEAELGTAHTGKGADFLAQSRAGYGDRNGPDATAARTTTARVIAQALDARAMETAFRIGLKSVENITHARRLQSGRLDRRAAVRMGTGALDVFTRRTVTEGVRTAVLVMIDGSSSMHYAHSLTARDGTRLVASRWQGAWAFASVMVPAIERAGADCAVCIFAENYVGTGDMQTVFEVKGWRQRAAAFRTDALDAAGILPWGGTPMEREARRAGAMLAAQRVERRVCLWLCDGEPENTQATARELDRQRRRGIEHLAVSIGSYGVQEVFGADACAVVNDLATLPAMVRGLLEGRR